MKVLIISYNPFSMSNNGGKLYISLFSKFKESELCQFYIYPRLPDGKYCHSYYQQTEFNLLKYMFNNSKKGNVLDDVDNVKNDTLSVGNSVSSASKFRALKLLLRDLLWSFSMWNTKKFKQWMQTEQPTCIFADTGDSCFLYKIAQKISKEYQLPMIGYFSDDYYSIRASKYNLVKTFQLWRLRKRIDSFVSSSKKILCINDTLRDYLRDNVKGGENISFDSIYMGNSISFENEYSGLSQNNLTFSYIGNLSYGRDENIIVIGEAIDSYNAKYKTSHKLEIYAKASDKFISECTKCPAIVYKGFIPGEQVRKVIINSDILVHTESFLPQYIEYTRFSLSTKIADSLASGKYLLAFGPETVASMQHLIKNQCALIATDKEMLGKKITELLSNPLSKEGIVKNALYTADCFHNTGRNSLLLYEELNKIIYDKSNK